MVTFDGPLEALGAPVGALTDRPETLAGAAAAEVVGEQSFPTTVAVLQEMSGVDAFRRAARSENTLAAYRADWSRFAGWCERVGASPLPAEPGVVAAYLAAAAQDTKSTPAGGGAARASGERWRYSPATMARWVSTINKAHDLAGVRPPGRAPEVAETMAGIRRTRATPPARKTPVLLADLEAMVAAVPVGEWPSAPGGIRNRCLLVMGWVGAFRRSELANLTVTDVVAHPEDGLHVMVRASKTDRAAEGHTFALPYAIRPGLCAPCALYRWRTVLTAWEGAAGYPGGRPGVMRACRHLVAGIDRHVCRQPSPGQTSDGPLFRPVRANGTIGDGPINGHAINTVVKNAAQAAGFDPSRIGGHSLRSGFVTQAFRAGATPHAIMRQTGHRDPKMLEIYARESAPLVGNAVTTLGL